MVTPYNSPDVDPINNIGRPSDNRYHPDEDKPGKDRNDPGKLKFPDDKKDPKKIGKGPRGRKGRKKDPS